MHYMKKVKDAITPLHMHGIRALNAVAIVGIATVDMVIDVKLAKSIEFSSTFHIIFYLLVVVI